MNPASRLSLSPSPPVVFTGRVGVEKVNRFTRRTWNGGFLIENAAAPSPHGGGVLDKPTIEMGTSGRESEVDLKKSRKLSPPYPTTLHNDSYNKRIVAMGLPQLKDGGPLIGPTTGSPLIGPTNGSPLIGSTNGSPLSGPTIGSPSAGPTNGSTLIVPTTPEGESKEALATLIAPVADDLRILNENLHKIVGEENPLLMAAAQKIFSAGGKRLRPALVFLVSKATSQMAGLESMRPQHWRLAQVIEMIHTASLMHDDVLDESATRRGKDTIHTVFGTRIAVLAGDFMFAQSSWYLANLDNLEVIKLISQVIKDFASGEVKQAMSLFDCDITLQDYLEKSHYKTASLIAASTRSAAIFSGMNRGICDQMYDYGLHLGLAFQVVDDILDFTQSSEQLGKPAGSDLAKGNLTAPVLFALQTEPRLRELIQTEFTEEGSLDAAIALVYRGGGIDKARQLAKEKGKLAMKNLECLPQSPLRRSLEGIVDYVLDRLF